MSKKRKSAIAIYAIIALVFTVLSLLVPFKKPASSWIMFAFSLVSIVAGLFISYYAFGKSEKLMSKFYGYPLFRIGYIYMGIQIAITIVLYVIGAFVDVPYWIGLIISVLIAGFAAIGCIVADNARDIVENIDVKERASIEQVTTFQIDISEILDLCKDEEIKQPLSKLVTKFKYSDPVSSTKTADKEKEISDALQELKGLIRTGEKQEILDKIDTVSTMLATRNRMCEAGK